MPGLSAKCCGDRPDLNAYPSAHAIIQASTPMACGSFSVMAAWALHQTGNANIANKLGFMVPPSSRLP
jgi:hypothetical protein